MAAKNDLKALIIFVDIRGFTSWSSRIDNVVILDQFIIKWYQVLEKNFPQPNSCKPLGDGAMIIQEITERTTAELLKKIISDTLEKIKKTNIDFNEFCKELSVEEGTKISLSLGWGITKGTIFKIGNDYIGADINKCSRYCDIARPSGIVIDADDFQKLPTEYKTSFTKQTCLIKGFYENCDMWVTKEIAEQFIPREILKENPEVHVAGICFRKEHGKFYVLLGKRAENRRLYPLLYEGCGGQLAHNELFHEGVKRHYEKEYHVEVAVYKDIYLLYEIIESNEPKIPGIRFLCEYRSGNPSSINHVPPTPKWFSETEFKSLPEEKFIPGLKKDIKLLLSKYKELP